MVSKLPCTHYFGAFSVRTTYIDIFSKFLFFYKKIAAVFRKMKIACNIDSFSPAFFFLRFFFGGIETPRYFTQFVANRPFSAILFLPHPSRPFDRETRSVQRGDVFFFARKERRKSTLFSSLFFFFLGKSGDREEGEEEEEEMHLSALRIPKGEDTRYIQKYFLQASLAQEQSHLFSLRVPFQPHHVSSVPPTFD